MEYQQTKAGEAQPGTAVVFGCGYKPADDEAQTRKVLVLYDQGANIFMIDHEFTFCTTVQLYSKQSTCKHYGNREFITSCHICAFFADAPRDRTRNRRAPERAQPTLQPLGPGWPARPSGL